MGNTKKPTPENYIKDIRRKTRRLFTAEQKVLIVMEALRAEISVAELCRLVREAGREPIQRDSVYNIVQRFDEPALA